MYGSEHNSKSIDFAPLSYYVMTMENRKYKASRLLMRTEWLYHRGICKGICKQERYFNLNGAILFYLATYLLPHSSRANVH